MTTQDQERKALQLPRSSRRVVVKVGSGVLCDDRGHLETKTLRRIAVEIAALIGPRRWPVIVSSGAIAVGMANLGLKSRPKTMPGLQAAAAVGQSKLVEAWSQAFRPFKVPVAQVLLTHADLANRRRFLNARHALAELAQRRAVAVINENDTVSFEEIAFGDNDQLAAQVCLLVEADLLIMLSVAGGILDGDGERVGSVVATSSLLDTWAQPLRSRFGSGGMISKISAARVAAARGTRVAIVPGKAPAQIAALLRGEDVGTLLVPDPAVDRKSSRSHWILHTLRPAGVLFLDPGATKAVQTGGKSLLAAGVVAVQGSFNEGDAVDLALVGAAPFARGLTRYSAEQLQVIKGHSSAQLTELLGFSLGEVVHRDDLVVYS